MKRGKPILKPIRDFLRIRSQGKCEARLFGCTWIPTEVHHRKSRARGGSNDPKNLDYICHKCHHKITTHEPGTERFRTPSWGKEGSTGL